MSFVWMLSQWLIFGLFTWQLPPQIPLYYSLPTGESQLADKNMFILIPLLSVGIIVINSILIRLNKDTPPIYPQIIAWATALTTFLATIGMLHITMLVL